MLTGYRTIIVAIVSGVLVPLATKYGFTLTADQQAGIISGGMTLAMIVMRLFTKTPVGQSAPKNAP